MRTTVTFAAVLILLLSGCQTLEHRAARLQTGMPRSEVIALLGPPRSAVHNGSLEVLTFDLTQPERGGRQSVGNMYYVIFGSDRRVESFGPN